MKPRMMKRNPRPQSSLAGTLRVAVAATMICIPACLAASAQEEASFNRWAAANPNDFKRIPIIDRQPILRLKWDRNADLLNPVVDLDYHGQYYQITDPETAKLTERASWNRDVFRLLVQLSSQVSIDISKYPLPTTLQVQP